ncbi:hypothetical protein ACFYKX_07265 [Cytobacillus sp. FJAT-54145]|uniref:Uncharacterized protein n=1 Tax=Cytobacillus spartinae TaxID=3299023 RepID=A0ABW6K8C4_9BACI
MDNELKSLKESLDETYLKEIVLSKSLKKKILKKTAQQKNSTLFSHFKFLSSVVLATGCLFLFVTFLIQGHLEMNQAKQPTLREKQVAIIHYQEKVMSILKTQEEPEIDFLSTLVYKYDTPREEYRDELILTFDHIVKEIKDIPIPQELSTYSEEIEESLEILFHSFELKREYYLTLNAETYNHLDKNVYGDVRHEQVFFEFERKIGKVFEEINLFAPGFWDESRFWTISSPSQRLLK